MFGKFKKWLGIEGVKLELQIPETVKIKSAVVPGKLVFFSLTDQEITKVKVQLIERYQRGRGKEKLADEYKIAEIELNQSFHIPANETYELDFSLPFSLIASEMDEFGSKNILFKGVAFLARKAYGAKSEFWVIAEANVRGVALNPFDKKGILLQ